MPHRFIGTDESVPFRIPTPSPQGRGLQRFGAGYMPPQKAALRNTTHPDGRPSTAGDLSFRISDSRMKKPFARPPRCIGAPPAGHYEVDTAHPGRYINAGENNQVIQAREGARDAAEHRGLWATIQVQIEGVCLPTPLPGSTNHKEERQ
jgi:hypothetical protein